MDTSNADINSETEPLTPAMFHVLLTLATQARHGYGIMQQTLADTGGALRLGPGTLYGTIKRLLAAQWIADTNAPASDADETDERRRYYKLTDAGRRALNAEARRLTRAAQIIQARGVLREGEAL